MKDIIKILKKHGGMLTSDLSNELIKKGGSKDAARQKISRALSNNSDIDRLTNIKFPHRARFIYLKSEGLSERFYYNLYAAFEIDKIVADEIQASFDILVIVDPQDSKYYINYLIREKFVDMFCRTPIENFIGAKIKEYENDEKIKSKYTWLKTYHDSIKKYKPTEQECKNWEILFPPVERDI